MRQNLNFLKTVSNDCSVCPYLEGKTAKMPLCVPDGPIDGAKFDELLDAGYRRSGWFFYRTECPACQACEPLRLEVAKFQESRSMRRVRKLGDQHLRIEVGPPKFDDQRLKLFNDHRIGRKLSRGEAPADASDYTSFLINALCEVWELSFWYQEDLVAISITDVAATSLSAVYCFFDPKYSWLSPGTYAILSQITLTQSIDYKWLYLGMYVRDNQHLCYKARYGPHERFIDGRWLAFS